LGTLVIDFAVTASLGSSVIASSVTAQFEFIAVANRAVTMAIAGLALACVAVRTAALGAKKTFFAVIDIALVIVTWRSS
jgi:hypothetical protein